MANGMTYRSLIRKGDALTWLVRPNTLADAVAIDGNWSCKAGLYDSDGVVAVADFAVTTKVDYSSNEYFAVTLSRTDTAALDVGFYTLAIDVRNDAVTPPYSDEEHIDVQLASQLVIPA